MNPTLLRGDRGRDWRAHINSMGYIGKPRRSSGVLLEPELSPLGPDIIRSCVRFVAKVAQGKRSIDKKYTSTSSKPPILNAFQSVCNGEEIYTRFW
jgi:hypothetical protein